MKKKKKKERKAIEIQKSSSYAGRACRNLERIWKNRPTKLKNFNDSTSLEIHLSPLPPLLTISEGSHKTKSHLKTISEKEKNDPKA